MESKFKNDGACNETSSRVPSENKKKKAFEKFREQITPLSLALLAVVLILSIVLSVVSTRLSGMESVHRAVYDKSQKIETASAADRIPLHNNALGDIAIPAIEGVPVSKYKDENFTVDDRGFRYYYEDSELLSYVGIDVSVHNGDIDWQAVKADGVDFVMLRIGGRGYGAEGVLYEDESLLSNLRGARAAGLWVGAYFFSQATTAEEAEEEAEYAVSLLHGEKLDFPLAFDWEIVESYDSTRVDNVDPRTLTDCARAFCDKVEKKGYIPMLYTGTSLAYYKYDLAQLADIDIWYASYSDSPDMYYNYMMWQYSSTGRVDGIDGDVDLNICFKNYK